jgi:HK97 family phage major capsid protein
MINKDLIKQANMATMQKLSNALQSNDVEAAANAMQELQTSVCDQIEAEFEQYKDVSDMSVLQSRGLRALTSEENQWYQKFISAVKSGVKQEITNIGAAIPVTIIDRVIDDIKKSHELLSAINLVDAAGAMKLVANATQLSAKLGSWGKVTSAIATEVTGGVKAVDVTAAKYTAYFLIPKDFVRFNFGFAPMWVDQYIRAILGEVIAFGLEKTILKGDGKDQFIGMEMNTTTASNGKYSAKAAKAITNFDDDYAAVIADLSVDENGDYRTIDEILLVVNPKDYIKKVRRAQNAVTSAGVIDLISLTYPTKVVQSALLAEGEAVVGIAKNYFAAINGGTSGIVEYDDSAQFLEDNRVYTTRVYGNGLPVDNTSFAKLDITGVEAPALSVKVKGTVTTKAQA